MRHSILNLLIDASRSTVLATIRTFSYENSTLTRFDEQTTEHRYHGYDARPHFSRQS